MTTPSNDPSNWSEFRSYLTASEAEVDAAYLRGEGIEAMITNHSTLPGQPGGAIIWLDQSLHERAAWLLKLPPVTDSELEFLATGILPKPEKPE